MKKNITGIIESFISHTEKILKEQGAMHLERGYFPTPNDNLILPSIEANVKKSYLQGDGHEWYGKFQASYSSAALVANHFGPFIKPSETTRDLVLPLRDKNLSDFTEVALEKKLHIPLKGNDPNLDALLENNDNIIAVESKCIETLNKHRYKLSDSYLTFIKRELQKPEHMRYDKVWNELIQEKESNLSSFIHLDVAQLVKHYIGIQCCFNNSTKETILLYLFWEPLNHKEIDVFCSHRNEISEFIKFVEKSSTVKFIPLSYLELWDNWGKSLNSSVMQNNQDFWIDFLFKLKKRYCFEV